MKLFPSCFFIPEKHLPADQTGGLFLLFSQSCWQVLIADFNRKMEAGGLPGRDIDFFLE